MAPRCSQPAATGATLSSLILGFHKQTLGDETRWSFSLFLCRRCVGTWGRIWFWMSSSRFSALYSIPRWLKSLFPPRVSPSPVELLTSKLKKKKWNSSKVSFRRWIPPGALIKPRVSTKNEPFIYFFTYCPNPTCRFCTWGRIKCVIINLLASAWHGAWAQAFKSHNEYIMLELH